MDVLKKAITGFRNLIDLETKDGLLIAKLEDGIHSGDLNSYLINKGIVLTHLAERKSSLEQKFLKILQETHD